MPLALFSLAVIVFSLTTGEFVIAGILPDIARDLSVSIPAAGLLVTTYAVGMIVGGPLVTVVTARVGRRRLAIGLVATAAVGNLASAFAPNYAVLLLSRFVAGLVVATFFALAITTAVALGPNGKPASAVAKLTLGLNLGIVLGTPIGTFIGQNAGWRATFGTVVVLSVVGLLLATRFVPDEPAPAHASGIRALGVFAGGDVKLAIALTAVGNVGVVMVFTYVSPLLTDVTGFAADAVPLLLLAYGVGAVSGNVLGGRLSDKALLPSLIGLLATLTGVLVLFWLASGTKAFAATLTYAIGVLAFAIIPGMQTRVMTTAKAAPMLAVAVNASGFQVAAACAGWLGGEVIQGPGLRSIPLVGAALTAVGLALAICSRWRDGREAMHPAREEAAA